MIWEFNNHFTPRIKGALRQNNSILYFDTLYIWILYFRNEREVGQIVVISPSIEYIVRESNFVLRKSWRMFVHRDTFDIALSHKDGSDQSPNFREIWIRFLVIELRTVYIIDEFMSTCEWTNNIAWIEVNIKKSKTKEQKSGAKIISHCNIGVANLIHSLQYGYSCYWFIYFYFSLEYVYVT